MRRKRGKSREPENLRSLLEFETGMCCWTGYLSRCRERMGIGSVAGVIYFPAVYGKEMEEGKWTFQPVVCVHRREGRRRGKRDWQSKY